MGLTALFVTVTFWVAGPFPGRDGPTSTGGASGGPDVSAVLPVTPPNGDDTSGTLPAITPALAGPFRVLSLGSSRSGALALTFDDGDCETCVAGVVAGAERTGAHITICPNGVYGPVAWDRYADRIKVMIARGQVAICNHTWDHPDLTKLDAAHIRTELARNEEWIEATFGVSSRPFFRPPYGRHNRRVDEVAAAAGYTDVLLWSATLGDSNANPPAVILGAMRRSATAGQVVLAHVNHPATAEVFDQLVGIARQAGLKSVTVPELFALP